MKRYNGDLYEFNTGKRLGMHEVYIADEVVAILTVAKEALGRIYNGVYGIAQASDISNEAFGEDKGDGKMISINFGKWNHMGGIRYCYDRIYLFGYRWTPFIRISKRHTSYWS